MRDSCFSLRLQQRRSVSFTSSCQRHETKDFSTSTHEHDISFDAGEHLHNLCLVWAPEVRPRLAAVEVILVSWGIALFEYCLAVPANRLGFVQFSGFQLKIIQEVITISVFIVFAIFYLKEKLAWNYLVAFAFLGVAAYFAFAFKAPGSAA
jgi:uncharacterized protein (DUF486 family)